MAGFLFFVVLGGWITLRWYGRRTILHRHYTSKCSVPMIDEEDILIRGKDLELTKDKLHSILMKRFPYYASLETHLQNRFTRRLKRFISNKIFIIKDNKGVVEMPVLTSAAAIQLTFGLKNYLLTFYKYIRIYPSEYLGDSFFKILAGNVQENVITVSWNHLLHGFAVHTDGQNLGVHEMSHALYIQQIVIDKNYALRFENHFQQLHKQCVLAHDIETKGMKNLYSEYAETNLQEFWAETVELFFERTNELAREYPDVFHATKSLLNQDPRLTTNPVLNSSKMKLRIHNVIAASKARILTKANLS